MLDSEDERRIKSNELVQKNRGEKKEKFELRRGTMIIRVGQK